MSERIDETRETEEAGQAVGGEAEGKAPDLALAEEESSQSGEEEESLNAKASPRWILSGGRRV